MRMLHVRKDSDLAQEPLGRHRQLAAEHLDRDVAIVPHVAGTKNARCTATAQLLRDQVPITKGALQAGRNGSIVYTHAL